MQEPVTCFVGGRRGRVVTAAKCRLLTMVNKGRSVLNRSRLYGPGSISWPMEFTAQRNVLRANRTVTWWNVYLMEKSGL